MTNEKKLESLILRESKKVDGMPLALSGGVDSSTLAAFTNPKFVISVELPGDEKYNEIEYSKEIAKHFSIQHHIVKLDESRFDEAMIKAVKAIGRPIPHFNIFPLYCMYEYLADWGETDLILGDGPDETMCGYARDLIFNYLYNVYNFEGFVNYKELIDKVMPPKQIMIEKLTGLHGYTDMMEADIAMRKDMDDMSNQLAKYFGIKNHRPYQDNQEIDDFMKNLPIEDKIGDVEYGKYLLRLLAAKYIPAKLAWRKKKVGGPVYPVNIKKGWMETDGEFGKESWIKYQQAILDDEANS